jgi:hypothetical protein
MLSISLETPEYATFHLGKYVDYRKSPVLILRSATKLTDIILQVQPLEPKISFHLRVDYHNANNECIKSYFSTVNYHGLAQRFIVTNPIHDNFICTYIKFVYEDTINDEVVPFLISAFKFEDEKEKQIELAREQREKGQDYPDYKDEM